MRMHRHHGIDFFLISQAPNLVNAQVLALVEKHLHIMPHWSGRKLYEWSEYCSTPRSTTSKELAVRRPYKLPVQSFDLYESASIHTKPKKTIPIRLYFSVLALIVAPVLVFMASQRVMARSEAPLEAAIVQAAPVSTAAVQAPAAPSVPVPAPENKPAMMPVQMLTASIDWKIVSACLQSENNGCICYGKSAERLVVPKESCELAVKHGWPGV